MKFYVAIDEDGCKQIRGTKEDILKVSKDFEQVDIPTDKEGLMALVQDSFTTIHQLNGRANSLQHDASINAVPGPSAAPPPDPSPLLLSYAKISENIAENFTQLPIAHQLSLAMGMLESIRNSEVICRSVDDR